MNGWVKAQQSPAVLVEVLFMYEIQWWDRQKAQWVTVRELPMLLSDAIKVYQYESKNSGPVHLIQVLEAQDIE